MNPAIQQGFTIDPSPRRISEPCSCLRAADALLSNTNFNFGQNLRKSPPQVGSRSNYIGGVKAGGIPVWPSLEASPIARLAPRSRALTAIAGTVIGISEPCALYGWNTVKNH